MNRYLKTMALIASVMFIFPTSAPAQNAFSEEVAPVQDKRPERFPNVKLTTEAGTEVLFADDIVKDKVVILNFMFTKCDDLCEKITDNLVQVQKALGDRLGKEVFINSITLDPKNDTQDVLKAYAESHDTKAGWNYLWGNAVDVSALSRASGMSALSPDLRKKLKLPQVDSSKNDELQHSGMLLIGNEATGEWKKVDGLSRPDHILQVVESMINTGIVAQLTSYTVTPKTVDAKSGNVWQPQTTNVVMGDVIEWRMNDNSGIADPDDFPGHGVRITNWAAVKDHVEVETVPDQQPFNAATGKNDTESKTVGQVLLRLKIKSVPPAPAEIKFNCTFHGITMAGKVTVAAAVDEPAAVTPKTVDAKSGNVWQPQTTNVVMGDVIEWRMNDNSGIADPDDFPGHGVRITNWAAVKDHVEVETVPDQQPFNAATGKNDTESKTVDQVLLRLKIKSVPPAPAEIKFNCTFHGITMAGKVTVAAAVDEPAAVTPKTVDAKSGNVWQPNAQNVVVGDVIEWRMNDSNATNPAFPGHGVRITNWAAVKDHVEVETVPDQQPFNAATGKNDTESKTVGQVLLRLKIKSVPPAPAEIKFNCTFHGITMAGKVLVTESSVGLNGPIDEEIFARMTKSMQRRMLRFVNRAHVAEDLMKNPQEFRTRMEHAPAKLHEKTSDAEVGFPLAAAKALLDRRPVNGFREVRECLPAYQVSDTMDQMGSVVESLGENQFGKWELIPGGIPSVMHAALMNNGKVVFITNSLNTCVWDPTSAPVVLPPSATNLTDILYCSGHSFLSDGKLLAVGGGGSNPGVDTSIHAWKFNPDTQKWSRTAGNMSFQRWYPTAVTLGDEPGRVLVVAGDTGNGPAPQMEVYSETTDKFEKVTVTGRNLLFAPTYPGIHLLPAGEILHVPTGFDDCNQTPSARSADPTALFTFSSPTSGSWRILGRNQRLKGMSTLLFDTSAPFIQALVVGGGNLAKNKTAQTINLTAMTPAWSTRFPLLEERIHPNLVQLPDGTVFICGGKETNPITPPSGGRCELYNPKTGVIAEMDEMIVPRHYHSVALLLPDGRVMAAGGADDGGCTISTRNTIEVFSPPYLFKPGRPKITSATKFNEHGGTIEIKTPSAAGIGRVVLVRPMAVTHQTDSEQRVLQLSFQVTDADTIEAQLPGLATGANPIAPRGHYMLFILNQQGVPSVAEWIYLGGTQVESLKAADTRPLKNDGDDSKLVDANGTKRSLSEFAGRAHMLVLIRGAFCKHCTSQLAEFQKRIDPAKIPVIVITPENDLADLEDVPFTVLADTELSVFRRMNALGAEPLHGTFVFDADGKSLLKEIGEDPFTDYDAIEKALSTIIR